MTQLNLIHLGLGNVGRAVMDMIVKNIDRIKEKQGMELKYCGFFTANEGHYYPFGFPFESSHSYENDGFRSTISDAIDRVQTPFAVIDTSASDKTYSHLLKALNRGGYVVMSNKRPLSSSQQQFTELHSFGGNRVHYETTVCAALPTLNTLHDLLLTGDEILEINGCFSGTMGYICSMMENGASYSETIKKAMEMGYTEPDPRDDLSGMDVARKALILARILGYQMELSDVSREPFYPENLQNSSVEEFMNKITGYNQQYSQIFSEAKKRGNTYRYVTHLSKNKIEVKLTETPLDSQIGRLKGLENIVIYKSKRYNEYPLIVQGPGGGIELAAGSVLADILKIGK